MGRYFYQSDALISTLSFLSLCLLNNPSVIFIVNITQSLSGGLLWINGSFKVLFELVQPSQYDGVWTKVNSVDNAILIYLPLLAPLWNKSVKKTGGSGWADGWARWMSRPFILHNVRIFGTGHLGFLALYLKSPVWPSWSCGVKVGH